MHPPAHPTKNYQIYNLLSFLFLFALILLLSKEKNNNNNNIYYLFYFILFLERELSEADLEVRLEQVEFY